MKKWTVVFALAAVLGGVGQARAATMDFGLTGGMAAFTGNEADVFKSGFMGGVYGDLWLTPTAAIGVDIVGNFHSSKDDYNQAFNALFEDEVEAELIAGGATGVDVTADLETKASLIQFGVHGKLALSPDAGAVRPFVQAGVGLYRIVPKLKGTVRATGTDGGGPFDETVELDESGDTLNELGLSGGAGVLFNAGPAMSIGVGANFHHVFTEDESTQYFTVGALLTFSTTPR